MVRFSGLMVLTLLALTSSAFGYPTISTAVTDNAAFLTLAEREEVSRLAVDHFQHNHVQIASLIIPTTGGEPINDYAHAVATAWGGGQSGADNGILVVLAINDRHSRIEVGAGLEARVTDAEAVAILDHARPHFRAQHFGAGLVEIVSALIARTGPAAAAPQARPTAVTAPESGDFPYWILVIAGVGLAFFVVVFLGSKSSRSYTPPRPSYDRTPATPAVPTPYSGAPYERMGEPAKKTTEKAKAKKPAAGTRYARYESPSPVVMPVITPYV